MKKLVYLSTAIVTYLLLMSCSESNSDDTSLTVAPDSITIGYDGGSGQFSITSNSDWTISTTSSEIQVSPTEGSGNKTVNVSVSKNYELEQRQFRLMIKTSNGAVVRNVTIIQEGYLITGGTLEVSKYGHSLALGGKEHFMDSLNIVSSTAWEIKGPSWIEVFNDSKWVALSPSRAVTSGNSSQGTGHNVVKLYIRTASVNTSQDNRLDTIVISQPYSGDLSHKMAVLQLGRNAVAPSLFIPMSTGLATDWKCGTNVDQIWAYVSETAMSNGEISQLITTSTNNSAPENVIWWRGLKDNTRYHLYAAGIDKQGNYRWDDFQFSTPSLQNQAIAAIENVKHENGRWTWDIKTNAYCKLFHLWATDNKELFNYETEYLTWIFNYMLYDEELSSQFPTFRVSDDSGTGQFWWDINSHIQILTCGYGQEGIKSSGITTRYRTIDHFNNLSRSMRDEPQGCGSMPKNLDAFKKSIHRIK